MNLGTAASHLPLQKQKVANYFKPKRKKADAVEVKPPATPHWIVRALKK